MKKLLTVVVLLIVVIYLWPAPAEEVVVHTPAPETLRDTTRGPVIGFQDADDTVAWLGIPFAIPPVGKLRWMSPRPAAAWQEPLEAISFAEPCVQRWGILAGMPGEDGQVVGSEDCLYLNIWAPRGNSSADSEALR